MSTADRRVDPTTPAVGTEPVRDFAPGRASVPFSSSRHLQVESDGEERAATTGGQMRAAYAQYVVDPHTHEVSVRIRDAATDQVIRHIPTAEIAATNRALRDYAEALALRHAAAQGKAGA